MSDINIDRLFEKLKKEGEVAGYYLNPDETFVKELLKGLITNEERYGHMACPCRLASGSKEEDLDIICPCDYRDPDLSEYGACYCGLYVSEEIHSGQRGLRPIPERRVPSEKRGRVKTTTADFSRLAYPVWRCKVCGYLCAREAAPSVCPICKAKSERFERFF